MREEYMSACNNTEETHRLVCVCVFVCVCVCVCVCVYVCVCVCCAQDVQTHLHNIYTCVNQHEGTCMFMYSVCAKYCMGKERLKSLQLVHKRVVEA